MSFTRYNSVNTTSTGQLSVISDTATVNTSVSDSDANSSANNSSTNIGSRQGSFKSSIKQINETDEIIEINEVDIKFFEEQYQLNFSLRKICNQDQKSKDLVVTLIYSTNTWFNQIENSLSLYEALCLNRQKHKTIQTIGILLCDIEQLLSVVEFFIFLTKDYDQTLKDSIVPLDPNLYNRIYRTVSDMLKFSIFPTIEQKFIRNDIIKVCSTFSYMVLEILSYLLQRMFLYSTLAKNINALNNLSRLFQSIVTQKRKKYQITEKLQEWIDEHNQCAACSREIGLSANICEVRSKLKWHILCFGCENCGKKIFGKQLTEATLAQQQNSNFSLQCITCAKSNGSSPNNSNPPYLFSPVSLYKQTCSLLKIKVLAVVKELEDDNFGFICQEWNKYWRMDDYDLSKYDMKTQKIQSGIFELIHNQQTFITDSDYFLEIGDQYVKDCNARPNELERKLYDLVFAPVKELRQIHKKLLFSPMKRFLFDQGMIIKFQVFKLYPVWISKSYHAYESYLRKLAESELLQELDKLKEVPHFHNWVKSHHSAKLEKFISGNFYYRIIQTKEIMKNIEKYLDKKDPENEVVFQTSKQIDKFSRKLHDVLDKATTRAFLSKITNLEVKGIDEVAYKKHTFVKYKSKVTNEVVDCCLILLNLCLVITKFEPNRNTFTKFAPLIYSEYIDYERIDAKIIIKDKHKDTEGYKVHFKNEEEAIKWININI